jgi:hypothetical protein
MDFTMADGRMLKKLISTSKKLANLKTDSARLLYTWILPHADIQGRFSGEPDIVKGSIVPRLKTMDYENVEAYLTDMVENNLIDLYEVDGDKYLEVIKFHDFQTLRKDRESPSRIPNKDGLLEDSRSTPAQAKTNEAKGSQGKLSEAKASDDKDDSPFPSTDRTSTASHELKFYELTSELFGVASKSDRTTLQNVAKHLSTKFEFDSKVFSKAWKVAQGCKENGQKPIALFLTLMKNDFEFRSK